MFKKITAIFMALIISAFALTACTQEGTSSSQSQTQNSSQASSGSPSSTDTSSSSDDQISEASYSTEMFSDGDFKDVSSDDANASITLSGNTGTISDTTRGSSGSEVTITSKGIYRISGSADGVSIVVNDSTKSGNIYLVLDNITMTNSSAPCINIQAADKVIIQCVGENSLTCNSSDSSAKADGAIYAKSDITINGTGKLNINSSLHGIVGKKDVKLTGASTTVKADLIGIQADNSLRISSGEASITSGHDAVHVSNSDNTAYFYLENSTLNINSEYDGISVTADSDSSEFAGYIKTSGGTINITSGGGSDNSKNSSTSQKGIKCSGSITLDGTAVTISSADDAIHGKSNITINSGSYTMSTSDDGITASKDIVINDGTVSITKSYEGIEAANVTINNGKVRVTSSDDGINTSGGSDTSSSDDNPWGTSTDASLNINGGNIYVNSSGDGLDSNGSIYITGGTVIIEGPTDDGNGSIDKGDGSGCTASITGGTVLAIGSSGMAVNFDSGSQCSALVSLSGDSGTNITVDDGSGFSYIASKKFDCIVYSSPAISQGNTYTISAGSSSASADFSSSLYYSNVQTRGSH